MARSGPRTPPDPPRYPHLVSEYIVVPPERAGLELDELLCLLYPERSKGYLRRQVRKGAILLDGSLTAPSRRVRAEQVLVVDFDESERPSKPPVSPGRRIPVLYEDDDVLVVDKPAGLAVEPERWAREEACVSGALLELARSRSEKREGERRGLDQRLRLVHRLDKGTSGALLAAKHLTAERALRQAFEERRISKVYLALVEGEHPLADGEAEEIDLPLGEDSRKGGRQCVSPRRGKPAQTRVMVERRFHGYTLLRCEPRTGRTHQIRVHLAAAGFPLAVDPLYGRWDNLPLSRIKAKYRPKRGRPERPLIDRLTLHAAEIEIPEISPVVSEEEGAAKTRVRVRAPLPGDMVRALSQLEKNRGWTA
jgi:23S rRNA pseudouridine1911/1915/1917 synthase